MCTDDNDSDCDDGGEGSDYSACDLGTDCNDCGVRAGSVGPIGGVRKTRAHIKEAITPKAAAQKAKRAAKKMASAAHADQQKKLAQANALKRKMAPKAPKASATPPKDKAAIKATRHAAIMAAQKKQVPEAAAKKADANTLMPKAMS